METKRFSPREFLRARRPERFSDSVLEARPVLDRSMLEYHLDTLTNRSQESDFERFARRLVEREVCPNLLPQTGPTGGGDSKVDAETYPVAEALSLIWYVGTGREAASERWAFAFSTKKDWRAKVQSDVAKIAVTERGYSKAFFVTNQYVPDRVRAQVEDDLRKKHGLDIRILDRTWILDRVFHGGHQALAIDGLKLSISARSDLRKGPLDLQRERDLEEIEERIKAATLQGNHGFQFVDDCIGAATLSRSLDRPRTEVEGCFLRAKRVAEQYGTSHQRLHSAYDWAWTAFWWYEDFKLFAELYGAVEVHAIGSRNVYDLELLTNLWNILYPLVRKGDLNEVNSKLQARTTTLAAELERLSAEQDRPSTALQAKTLRLQMRLVSSPPNTVDAVLRELQDVVRGCEGLVGYPLDPLVKILSELGNVFGGRPAYEDLFETIVAVASAREGQVAAARMLLKRGNQHLEANRPYEAIKSLGRALRGLYNHESRHDVIRALYLCGRAYERVGLLWAARGSVLTAASVAANDFWTYADVTPQQADCYNRMKWLELQLGRLPQTLAWHELDRVVRDVLVDQGHDAERLAQTEWTFDVILGILLLKSNTDQLRYLSALPDVLATLGLHHSAVALIFALGHEEAVPDELVEDKSDRSSLYEFFTRWRDQPAAQDLPAYPCLYEGEMVTLSSKVLGCRITVESKNSSPCVEMAESVLAALESFLSTGLVEPMVAREPDLTVGVRESGVTEPPFSYQFQDRDGVPHLDIQCGAFAPGNMEAQLQIKERLFDLLVSVLARVFLIRNAEEVVGRLFRDELALERSINFTSSFGALGNVLGHTPKTRMSAWLSPDAEDYPLKRSDVWDASGRREGSGPSERTSVPAPAFGKGEPPPELLDTGNVKHTEMETVSFIREVLWDQAGWCGTAPVASPDGVSPPVLLLVFQNTEAAGKIFAHWRKGLGAYDTHERLRLTIIRGICRENPHAYRVAVGANPAAGLSRLEVKYAFMVARVNTMDPSSDHNLTRFLRSYNKFGAFILAYGIPTEGGIMPIKENHIIKRELHLREAWEIGRHDPDCFAIREDDDPVIPPAQSKPPVLDLLQWLREQ